MYNPPKIEIIVSVRLWKNLGRRVRNFAAQNHHLVMAAFSLLFHPKPAYFLYKARPKTYVQIAYSYDLHWVKGETLVGA